MSTIFKTEPLLHLFALLKKYQNLFAHYFAKKTGQNQALQNKNRPLSCFQDIQNQKLYEFVAILYTIKINEGLNGKTK